MEVACKSMATAPPTIVDRAKAIYVFANEKGGMANLNVEVINKIIMETSGNSAYTAKQLKSDARVDLQVEEMRRKLARADEGKRRAARLAVAHRTAELERSRRLDRVCAVIDFDMFYAAVEIRDRPELASKPVAVGGVGMISTANYVARRWGVRSAMPGFVGQALCRRGPEVRPISAKWLCPSSAHSGRTESDRPPRAFSCDPACERHGCASRSRTRRCGGDAGAEARPGEQDGWTCARAPLDRLLAEQ